MAKKMSDEFEKNFSYYIDGAPYDKAEETLFDIIRDAYRAGWNDALKSNTPLVFIHERKKTD